MKSIFCHLTLALLAAVASVAAAQGADLNDTVMRAMRDELARSMAQLQLENLDKPYFISYRAEDSRVESVGAEFGSLLGPSHNLSRAVTIEVRVGSPALDNTNFLGGGGGGGTLSFSLPIDDNYDGIRRMLWLGTDRAYKNAVEQLARKKAALQNKTRTDTLPDFSAQPPATITDLHPGRLLDRPAAESLVRELSAVFRETPGIATSRVALVASEDTTRYVNSEGSAFVRSDSNLRLGASATTQADDGFPLDDNYRVFARSWATLPPKAELLAAVGDLSRRVSTQRNAGLLEQYNGPVLVEGQAAVEIFAEVFAPLLSARPRPVVDGGGGRGGRGGRGFGGGGGEENPFLDKLGARVLPDFFTVVDNPTITELNGRPMFGDSKVDDEGVPTRPVSLVEKGRLKSLLVSRAPVRGLPRSTGSMQGDQPGPSNLIVSATDGVDAAALKAELLKLLEQRGKDFGVIIRRLESGGARRGGFGGRGGGGGGGSRSVSAIVAVKVFPDGHEEPVRNLEIAGIDAPTFKDILVAGREPFIDTVPFRNGYCSLAVPSLLFEDLTLKKPAGEIGKPPIAKHPFFDK